MHNRTPIHSIEAFLNYSRFPLTFQERTRFVALPDEIIAKFSVHAVEILRHAFLCWSRMEAKTKEQRKNLQFNQNTGEWEKKWGYKGKGSNKVGDVEKDWVVEVDAKKEAERKEGETVRGDSRRERKEKVRRNERKQRSNEE